LVATTNAQGGSQWKTEYIKVFSGKQVCVIGDADETGRRHARQVAGSLVAMASSVKLIELDVKDLTEWSEKGGTKEKLADLFRSAPALTPEDVADWWNPSQTARLVRSGDFLLEPKWSLRRAQ
jgi:hypothetical protein